MLLLNTDYPAFLSQLYGRHPWLARRSFERQMAARNASLFGTADFMSFYLRAAGHEAVDIHANNRALQEAWLADGKSILPRLRRLLQTTPLLFQSHEQRFYDILDAQIRAFRPDIIYNHDISGVPADRLSAIKPSGCRLVGQIASPMDEQTHWHRYDLIVSSLPNYVDAFRRRGIAAAYLPLAFDRRILERVRPGARDVSLSFVGSVTAAHAGRRQLLEKVARCEAIEIWGDGIDTLPPDSPIRDRHRGVAWGADMFRLFARSRITLNKHIDISESYANNMRLFEATGMGALLLTDWKENLPELFEVGTEVVAYRSAEECVDLARHFAGNDSERERIMAAGMARCLSDHTYERRMPELADLLMRRLG